MPNEWTKRDFQKKWIQEGIADDTINYVERLGKLLAGQGPDLGEEGGGFRALTTSQIRNVFGEVRRIQGSLGKDEKSEGVQSTMTLKSSILMLQPKLAYATARAGTRGSEIFQIVLTEALKAIDTSKDNKVIAKQYQNFCDFFEAILAYHKVNGGRN
ncbi:MAG: type III-A CRISPR-associated protein Csm2 [Bernardetiaceae bacterium]|nr:type III-A CRISPR-associated protein Csm2 [Bernardetiaceae bacterium]